VRSSDFWIKAHLLYLSARPSAKNTNQLTRARENYNGDRVGRWQLLFIMTFIKGRRFRGSRR
jgi:hypothetical protein